VIHWMPSSIQFGLAQRSFHWRALFLAVDGGRRFFCSTNRRSHIANARSADTIPPAIKLIHLRGLDFTWRSICRRLRKLSTAIGGRESVVGNRRPGCIMPANGQLELILANCLPYQSGQAFQTVRSGLLACRLHFCISAVFPLCWRRRPPQWSGLNLNANSRHCAPLVIQILPLHSGRELWNWCQGSRILYSQVIELKNCYHWHAILKL